MFGVWGVETGSHFAFSFDGLLPAAMSKVTSNGSPRIATFVALIPGLLFLAVGQFTNVLSLFAYLVIFWFRAYIVVAVAAIVFPCHRRKDLFDASPSIVKRKADGIPIIVKMGVATLIECTAGIYAIVEPTITGSFLALAPLLYGTLIPLGLGWVIYDMFYYYGRSRNSLFLLRFKDIPPE